MPFGNEEDTWQIDPLTSRVCPVAKLRDPVLVVVEPNAGLASMVAEICDFLRVDIIAVIDPRDIQERVGDAQIIAVLQEADTVDCAVYDLLMIAASLDPNLPILFVLPDDAQNRGALDAAQRLWQLTDIASMPRRPGIRRLIDFLFRAGRRFGRTGPMPV